MVKNKLTPLSYNKRILLGKMLAGFKPLTLHNTQLAMTRLLRRVDGLSALLYDFDVSDEEINTFSPYFNNRYQLEKELDITIATIEQKRTVWNQTAKIPTWYEHIKAAVQENPKVRL